MEWMYLVIGVGVGAIAFFLLNRGSKNKQNATWDQTSENLKQQMQNEFRNLADDIFKKNQEQFLSVADVKYKENTAKQQTEMQMANKKVEDMLKPLSETLGEYRKNLHRVEEQRNKDYGSLDQLLKSVLQCNSELRNETTNLVHALKRPTVRGRWGEIQLRRVVEMAEMSGHCDFTEQSSVTTEEGRLRPDLIVKLPNKRQIIVDSKAVLDAYLEAESQSSDKDRKRLLAKHAAAVRIRVQELSRKTYWDQFDPTPEFVVLYIPGEAFFSAALQVDPDLVEYGFQQKVILATPTTLMALLKAVAYGWRQEQLAENAKKISEQAERIYNAVGSWFTHFATVGQSLDRATKSYNSAVGSMERRVLPATKKLTELGVKAKADLPEAKIIDTTVRQAVKDSSAANADEGI